MNNLCFVIMPYGEKKDIDGKEIDFDKIYESMIKGAVASLDGLICQRCDDIEKPGWIHERMLRHIFEDRVAIVDTSTLNANVFYELGVRAIGLTHARRNAAGAGGLFASSGSSPDGLTAFGRDVVQQCEALGVIVDLAHISPAGFEDILAIATKPPIVSHTNVRKYYDIERNISDEQIKMIGERRGVIGVNAVLVSPKKEESTLDRYIDHIEHMKNLIGIDGVAIGFDFFEFIYRQWPESARKELAAKFTTPHFIPDLSNHSHARNLTRRLIERGFSDMEIEKILRGNWMRIFKEIL